MELGDRRLVPSQGKWELVYRRERSIAAASAKVLRYVLLDNLLQTESVRNRKAE